MGSIGWKEIIAPEIIAIITILERVIGEELEWQRVIGVGVAVAVNAGTDMVDVSGGLGLGISDGERQNPDDDRHFLASFCLCIVLSTIPYSYFFEFFWFSSSSVREVWNSSNTVTPPPLSLGNLFLNSLDS
jgi:hypothetical protein